jgi:predicted transcriptional regulator
MTVNLNPEQQRRIQDLIDSGLHVDAQNAVDRALELLFARYDDFVKSRGDIVAMIEEGFAEAERGELIDGDVVRAEMAAMKKAWLAEKRTA